LWESCASNPEDKRGAQDQEAEVVKRQGEDPGPERNEARLSSRSIRATSGRLLLSFSVTGIFLIWGASLTYAVSSNPAGLSFLKLGVGARATAMGEAFTAVADDSTSLYWNPAGLASLKGSELSASYSNWFQGISHGYLSLGFPLGRTAVGIGANYLAVESLDGRDDFANPTGTFDASDTGVWVGFAVRIGRVALGASAGGVRSTIAGESEETYLGTVGGLFSIRDNVTVGAAVHNLGAPLGEDPLPRVVRGGVAVTVGSFILAADAWSSDDSSLQYSGGLEGRLGQAVVLRCGYMPGREDGPGWTAGLGLRAGSVGVDYAYLPRGELGPAHRASFTAYF